MHVRFEFAAGPRVLRAVFEGVLDDRGLRDAYSKLEQYARATDAAVGIWDMAGVTDFKVHSDTVRELGRLQPAMPEPALPRFIVAPTDHLFGMARMFQGVGDATRPQLK